MGLKPTKGNMVGFHVTNWSNFHEWSRLDEVCAVYVSVGGACSRAGAIRERTGGLSRAELPAVQGGHRKNPEGTAGLYGGTPPSPRWFRNFRESPIRPLSACLLSVDS